MNKITIDDLINYVQNDLSKLNILIKIYNSNNKLLNSSKTFDLLIPKSFNQDSKETTKKLIIKEYSFHEHNQVINETDRTIIGLLWHENIIDYISKFK